MTNELNEIPRNKWYKLTDEELIKRKKFIEDDGWIIIDLCNGDSIWCEKKNQLTNEEDRIKRFYFSQKIIKFWGI